MCRLSSKSGRERDLWVQDLVLMQIVGLHPALLTSDEMVAWLEDSPTDDIDRFEIMDAIDRLRRSGLLRQGGEVLEPTFAALCALKVLRS